MQRETQESFYAEHELRTSVATEHGEHLYDNY